MASNKPKKQRSKTKGKVPSLTVSTEDDDENTFKQMITLLQNTVDSLNITVCALNNTVATLERFVSAQQKLIERLESRVVDQDKQIAELKSQQKRQDRLKVLKFSGLSCRSNDGKEEVLQCIREKMQVQISDIDIVTRILRPRNFDASQNQAQFPELSQASQKGSSETLVPDPVTVLVSFQNIWQRKQVYYSKKSLKNTNIFVAEDLTKEDGHLFYLCRQLRKTGKIKATWTKELNIIVKTMADEVKTIKHESDLAEFSEETDSQTPKKKASTKARKEVILPPRSVPVTRSKAAAQQAAVTAEDSSSSSSASEDDEDDDSPSSSSSTSSLVNK